MQRDDFPNDPLSCAEPPISQAALRAGIESQPAAAQTLLNLLRALDLDDLPQALTQESLAYGALQESAAHALWLSRRPLAAQRRGSGNVHVTRSSDTLDITLDRPATLNAIDRSMRDTLFDGFSVAAIDPAVTRVRLSGAGKAFCVGADLDEFGTTRDATIAHGIRMQTLPARAIIGCIDKFEAHVHGACVGAGMEMAAFAHRLTATRDAWFQLPELAMGLIPGAGGCVSVPRRIGRRRAAALVLSGRRINARTALEWGLIDAIVDDVAVDHREPDIVSRQP